MLDETPGFIKENCVIQAEHSCDDNDADNCNEHDNDEEMVHLFSLNESKLEFYEKIRNEFVYRVLIFMEYFEYLYTE
jgi:hypothetical protein